MATELWPRLNAIRHEMIEEKVAGRLPEAESKLLDALNEYTEEYLEREHPKDWEHLEEMERRAGIHE